MAQEVLNVTRAVTAELAVISAVGEIDLGTAPELDAALADIVESVDRPAMVVADLSGVTFLGSSGLAVLTGWHNRCDELAVPFVVVVAHPSVRRILALTKLDHVLDIIESIADLPARSGSA